MKNETTGIETAAVKADKEEYLKVNAINSQVPRAIKAIGQLVISSKPNADDTPFPPLNFNQTGNMCPITPKEPAIKPPTILVFVAKPYINKSCSGINLVAIYAAIPALKASNKTVNKASHLFPVLKTLVAPMLPEPIFLMSPYPAKRVKTKPKGIEPKKYPTKAQMAKTVYIHIS